MTTRFFHDIFDQKTAISFAEAYALFDLGFCDMTPLDLCLIGTTSGTRNSVILRSSKVSSLPSRQQLSHTRQTIRLYAAVVSKGVSIRVNKMMYELVYMKRQ